MTIYERAQQHQRALLHGDAVAAVAMLEAYKLAWRQIRVELDFVIALIAKHEKAGKTVSITWLFRQERLKKLIEAVEREIDGYSKGAEVIARNVVAAAGVAGQQFAAEAVSIGTEFDRFPVEAYVQAVGLADTKIFNTFGKRAAAEAKAVLLTSIAKGWHPSRTAKEFEKTTGMAKTRARTIARTEQLRIANQASLSVYQANADVVEGWISIAQLGPLTCPVCVALHNTTHSLDEPGLPWHPNCRCVAVPKVIGYKMRIQSGEAWFAKQGAALQQEMLGPAKHRLYASGKLKLADLVKPVEHPKWGTTMRQKTLDELAA